MQPFLVGGQQQSDVAGTARFDDSGALAYVVSGALWPPLSSLPSCTDFVNGVSAPQKTVLTGAGARYRLRRPSREVIAVAATMKPLGVSTHVAYGENPQLTPSPAKVYEGEVRRVRSFIVSAVG